MMGNCSSVQVMQHVLHRTMYGCRHSKLFTIGCTIRSKKMTQADNDTVHTMTTCAQLARPQYNLHAAMVALWSTLNC